MVSKEAIRQRLQAIRVALDDLEGELGRLLPGNEDTNDDPYRRRRDILELIYERGGIDKGQLLHALKEHGTQYQWIGMQVKKNYLSIVPLPGGRVQYTVTPKAVRELRLGRESSVEEAGAWARLSEEAFAQDWNSDEDAIYDRL